MNIVLGLVIALGCILGGFLYMGCELRMLMEPSEYIILLGAALGTFIVANPFYVLSDTIKGAVEALLNKFPQQSQYISVISALYSLMREMRSKPMAEVEKHIDEPETSSIFQKYPYLLNDSVLLTFICDYCRLIIMGNARSFEVESLMDEEIETIEHDYQKPVHALQNVADGLPALGIVAAVLGIIRALSNINVKAELLGHYIGSALIGTFAGVFFAYAIISPIATKIKFVREQKLRLFIVIKQTLLAYMNGSMPQIALEYGRKTIPEKYRPSIDVVERDAIASSNNS